MIVIDSTGRVTRQDSSGDALIVFADAPTAEDLGPYEGARGVVWIAPGTGREMAVPCDARGVVTADVDVPFGGRTFQIPSGSRLSREGEGAPIVIEANGGSVSTFTIDTAGPRAGIVAFLTSTEIDPSDLTIRYFYTSNGALASFAFRLILGHYVPTPEASAPGRPAPVSISLDPNRRTDPARSFVRTTGLDIDYYYSTFRTPSGGYVVLSPADKTIGAQAWDPVAGELYLTPSGAWNFYSEDGTSIRMMFGLSGAEFGLALPSAQLNFVPGSPAFAPSFLKGGTGTFPLTASDGGPEPVTTAWIYPINDPQIGVQGAPGGTATVAGYYSSPAAGPLFIVDSPNSPILAAADAYLMPFNATEGRDGAPQPGFPAVPYTGFIVPETTAGDPPPWADLLRQFETDVLAPARSRVLWDMTTGVGPSGPDGPGVSFTTPQGVVSLFGFDGTWQTLDLAQFGGGTVQFGDISGALFDALLSTQLFLVTSDATLFENYASTLYSALGIAGWTFELGPQDWNDQTIFVIKYSDRDFMSAASDLSVWTLADEFNVDPVDTQRRLLDFLHAAQADRASDPDLDYFVSTVLSDPAAGGAAWNGVLFLNTDMPVSALPPQLLGLGAGIQGGVMNVHHVGISTSSFSVDGLNIVPGNSSVFALIKYEGQRGGSDAPYDFKVLKLEVEFVNSALVAFSSQIELIIKELFGEPAALRGSAAGDANAIVLNGQWQQHGGQDSFTFTLPSGATSQFDVASAVVRSLTITEAQFVTLPGASSAPGSVAAQFILGGDLQFNDFSRFDPFSFGPTGQDQSSALSLANLLVGINQPPGGTPDYFFDAGQVTFDPSASLPRAGGLFSQFPLGLAGMRQSETSSGDTVTPASLGYFSVGSPLADPGDQPLWFGLLYDLSLGSAGALARFLNFTSELLVVWSPSADGAAVSLWLKLPGNGSDAKSVTIEGPLALTVGGATLTKDSNDDYLLAFENTVLGALGIPLIDPQVGFPVVLFGNPDPSGTNTLGWYAVAENSSVSSLISAKFLAVSQNLALRDATPPTSMADVMKSFKAAYPTVGSIGHNPLGAAPALKFSGTGNWMIGASLLLADTVAIDMVFADPSMYGLHVTLSGAKAKALAGLDFEILYTKITDTVGRYHGELQLPDQFRKFTWGPVSVTVPALILDIYTDGSFYVNCGFPTGSDFSKSFSLQSGPLTGQGGFYFGSFTAATSPIPQPNNGTFAPVTTFGVGLLVRYGKSIPADGSESGVFYAKASVQLVGIIEGTFASFTPYDPTVSPDEYYVVTGTLTFTAAASGKVDLKIIAISFSASLTAQIHLVVAAHEPVELDMSLDVEVSASVKVLWVTIPLSFSKTLDFSMEIGTRTTPPWTFASGADALTSPFMLRNQRSRYRPRRLTPLDVRKSAAGQAPDWTPVPVFEGDKKPVPLAVLPALTVALDPGTGTPRLQVVMGLFAFNSIDPSARTAADVRATVTDGAYDAPFNVIARAMLYWAVAAQTHRDPTAAPVTLADLQAIAAFLSDASNRDGIFTWDRLSQFLERNCTLFVGTPDEGDSLGAATVFPMIPALTMTPEWPGPTAIDFLDHNPVGATYVSEFQAYFNQLQFTGTRPDPAGDGSSEESGEESFSSLIFGDYFGLIASEVAQSAFQMMKAYPYEPTGASAWGEPETLDSIASHFDTDRVEYRTRRGDTLLDVAAALRVSTAELRRWNDWLAGVASDEPLPEHRIVVAEVGPTVPAIVEKNPGYPLQAGAWITLGDTKHPITYQIRSGDSLQGIAATFGLADVADLFDVGDAVTNAYTVGLLVVGAFTVEGYQIKSHDTVATVAAAVFGGRDPLGEEIDELVADNATNSSILNPLAVLVLPPFYYEIGPGDTFASVASKFDLTLDELAAFGATAPAILQPYGPSSGPLTVPNVASRDLEELVDDMIDSGEINNLAAMVSRFLLQGLRVPVIAPDGGANFGGMTGLYDMVGQQFAAPEDPLGGTYPVVFNKAMEADWICLQPPGYPFGVLGVTGCVDGLIIALGPSFFANNTPADTLVPDLLDGPTAMALYHDLPPRYPMSHSIPWQTGETVYLPGPTGSFGGPSIWMFPSTLLDAIAGDSGNTQYELVSLSNSPQGPVSGPLQTGWAWATAVPFRVRRTPSIGGDAMPNSYVVVGADQSSRDRLLEVWQYASANAAPYDRLYLLHAPADDVNSNGLASDALDRTATFLLQTNLTTVTESGAEIAAAAGQYYSRATSIPDFLRLVWEASVTGSGGFYLNYATASGAGLPPAIFSKGGEATLWLMILGAQADQGSPWRGLYAFNNCALVNGNPDAGSALYAQLQTPQPADLQRHANVGPGTIGFTLTRANPIDDTGPTAATQQLFSLLGYEVVQNDFFTGSNAGIPVGPLSATGNWLYQQLVPIYRFGVVNDCPPLSASQGTNVLIPLPDPLENPYRGITGPAGLPNPNLSFAGVTLNFNDVYGNQTLVDPPLGQLDLSVGYTDPIIPISSWPGAAFGYAFAPGDSGPTLTTTLTLDLPSLVPGGGVGVQEALDHAAAAVKRYTDIYYQVQQHDLQFTLTSNLGATGGDFDPDDLKAPILGFVTKALVFASNASQLGPVTTTNTDDDVLAVVAQALSVTAPALVAANDGLTMAQLFSDTVTVPQFTPAKAGDTLDSYVGTFGTPGEVAAMNAAVPLTPGLVLKVTAPQFIGRGMTPPQSSLAHLAAAAGAAVYSPFPDPNGPASPAIGLYPANAGATGIVQPGHAIQLAGRTVTTDGHTTLHGLYTAFADKFPSEAQFAAALATVWGLFTDPVRLNVDSSVVPPSPPPFSLSQMPAADGSPSDIGTLNAAVPGFFVTNSPVYISYTLEPPTDDTIALFAADNGITVEQLAQANLQTEIQTGVALTVPGAVQFTTAPLYLPYTPSAIQPIDWYACRYLRGIFIPGARISGQLDVVAGPLDSPNDLAEQAGVPYDDFARFVADIHGIFRSNGGTIWAGEGPYDNINDAATSWNVDPVAFVTVNRALVGFLPFGYSIVGPGASINVGQFSTVDTVIQAFAALDPPVVMTIDELVQLNGGDLPVNPPFLVPPQPTEISIPFQPAIPPPGTTAEDSFIFPVQVSAQIDRAPSLVHPDFVDAPGVATISSPLAATPSLAQGSLVLDVFAESFEQAFAAYGLKCAISKGRDDGHGRIWAVNFGGSGGVSALRIESAQPQFYALEPLSTSLLAGDATFVQYMSGCGLCGDPVTKSYDSVDLDTWMRQLLSTIDVALSAPYAVPGFQVSLDAATTARPSPSATEPRRTGPVGFGGTFPSVRRTLTDCSGCGATADGPTDFAMLVQAKQDIADALSLNVSPILDFGAGATSGWPLTVAADALNQQMLVRLADAYNVAAILEFPVTVYGPFGATGSIWPRLSGKAMPVQYTTPPGTVDPPSTSLAGVAAFFQVSPAYLAEVLGSVQGLLQPDIIVEYQGATHSIGASDTIDSLAVALHVPEPDTDGWAAWTECFEGDDGIRAVPLFYANATFPLTAVERPMASEFDSLETFADFIDRDITDVGRASQSVVSIFQAGDVFAFPPGGPTHMVPEDATILQLAQNLGTTVDGLAEAVLNDVILSEDLTLHAVLLQPDVSLSTSKISLGNGGLSDDETPTLTVLVTVKQPARDRNVFLNLDYTINQVEYGIEEVSGTDGYQSSSWLTFVLPIGSGRGLPLPGIDTSIPQTQVPIPLRAYPAAPQLLAQGATASVPQTRNLDQAKLWDYRFEVRTDLADQDTAHIFVYFTAASSSSSSSRAVAASVSASQDLFNALAGFSDAYPHLKNDLALLAAPGGNASQTGAYALQALAQIAAQTAAALGASPAPDVSATGVTVDFYTYDASTSAEADGFLRTLRLVTVFGNTVFPEVWVQIPASGEFLELPKPTIRDNVGDYDYPSGQIPAGVPITHRYVFTGRDVIRNKNAFGGISVTRNDNLVSSGPLGLLGPTGAYPTNPSFVYSTSDVRFIDPMTPYLEDDALIGLGCTAPSLTGQIWDMLTSVLELDADQAAASVITLQCNLGLAAGATGIDMLASTPVRLVPETSVGPDNFGQYGTDLANSLARWLEAYDVSIYETTLLFDLTVFGNVPTGPTASVSPDSTSRKPVLRLRNLVPLDDRTGPEGLGT